MCANRTQVRHLLRREAAGELHLYFATIMRAFDAALLREEGEGGARSYRAASDATRASIGTLCRTLLPVRTTSRMYFPLSFC